jgi:hypothetical protein
MVAVLGRPAGHLSRQKLLRAKLELLAEAAVRWAETRHACNFSRTRGYEREALEDLLDAIAEYKRVMKACP